MNRHLLALLPLALFLLPACARQAPPAPQAVDTAAVVVVDPSGSMPVEREVAPNPRVLPLEAELGDAEDAMDVYIVRSANGAWKIQYPNGQRIVLAGGGKLTEAETQRLGKLVLPVNRSVSLTAIADGPTALLEILRFGVATEVKEGKYTRVTFKPTRTGEFAIRSGGVRIGTVLVVPDREFDDWLLGIYQPPGVDQPVDGSLAHTGRQLFLKLQCIRCHTATPNAKGPLLEGLYGTKVPLKGGGTEIADEHYIIESIRKPRLKVVDGWEAIMPAYDDTQVTAEELNALAAYIRSLKKRVGPEPKERFPAPVGVPTERPREPAPPPREK